MLRSFRSFTRSVGRHSGFVRLLRFRKDFRKYAKVPRLSVGRRNAERNTHDRIETMHRGKPNRSSRSALGDCFHPKDENLRAGCVLADIPLHRKTQ